MNSIKNVPARVLNRRPGHSLEAEREQFDKTQASGGGRGRAGGRTAPSPLPLTHVPRVRPAPVPGAPQAPRSRPPGFPWLHLGHGHPSSPASAAPGAGEPEARAGARTTSGAGGWVGRG